VGVEELDRHGVYDPNSSVYTRGLKRSAAFQAYTDQREERETAIDSFFNRLAQLVERRLDARAHFEIILLR
jgi:hypothetical protein